MEVFWYFYLATDVFLEVLSYPSNQDGLLLFSVGGSRKTKIECCALWCIFWKTSGLLGLWKSSPSYRQLSMNLFLFVLSVTFFPKNIVTNWGDWPKAFSSQTSPTRWSVGAISINSSRYFILIKIAAKSWIRLIVTIVKSNKSMRKV